ncbi:MAG: hypothetical protein C0418_05870 [Coriobacteriaceae bacterium]|nr:hypothetical protein [Coriobacteriaceae bacterium]
MRTAPRVLAAALFVCALLAPATAHAASYVLDEANVLPAESEARIDELGASVEELASGSEIAVLTVRSLGGRTIEDVAETRFEQIGLGQADKDNGVLLLVAVEDRQMRIEVGYGLEGAIPDAEAGRIITEVLRPRFQAGDMADGIEAGYAEIARDVAEEYGVDIPGLEMAGAAGAPGGGSTDAAASPVEIAVTALFVGLMIVLVIVAVVRSKRSGGGWTGWTGGGPGGSGGGGSGSGGGGGGGGSGSGGGGGGGGSGGGGASGDW